MSTPYPFVARIEAKPDRAEDVAALLTGALPLGEAEHGRLVRGTNLADHVLDLRHFRQRRRASGAHQRRDRGGAHGRSRRASREPTGDPRRRRACQEVGVTAGRSPRGAATRLHAEAAGRAIAPESASMGIVFKASGVQGSKHPAQVATVRRGARFVRPVQRATVGAARRLRRPGVRRHPKATSARPPSARSR
jgi:hypothetical protein